MLFPPAHPPTEITEFHKRVSQKGAPEENLRTKQKMNWGSAVSDYAHLL